MAKLLIRSHLVAFRLHSYRLRGTQGGRGREVAAFAGTTKPLTLARTLTLALWKRGLRGLTTHAINVRAGAATAQWAVVVVLATGTELERSKVAACCFTRLHYVMDGAMLDALRVGS